MPSHRNAAFSFVWRPRDLSPEALCAHRDTGTNVILDLSHGTPREGLEFLRSEPLAGFAVDVKIPLSWLFETEVEELAREPAIG
ncbi:MAG: hypothetical protein HGA84_06875, partial [Syntrophobacteraceae bacterium]|nr:hypothetical protein [Syntrophobacteraceae bacterium]